MSLQTSKAILYTGIGRCTGYRSGWGMKREFLANKILRFEINNLFVQTEESFNSKVGQAISLGLVAGS